MDNPNDLISRAAACECIGKMIHEYREKGEYALADGMILVRRYGIKRLPAVDAVPVVHGRWIYHDDDMMPWVSCSECDVCTDSTNETPYCPFCGAKMDSERRDEDATG